MTPPDHALSGSRVTTPPMDIKQHLIDRHGYTWQYANHPSRIENALAAEHERLHSDDTAVHLDHDHEGFRCVVCGAVATAFAYEDGYRASGSFACALHIEQLSDGRIVEQIA